jgi:hypothetical protein
MPDLIAPTAWSAPAIATTLRKTTKLKRPNRQTRFAPDETIRDDADGVPLTPVLANENRAGLAAPRLDLR